jgi:hypothetical protein
MSLNDNVLPKNVLNEAEQPLFKACSASFKTFSGIKLNTGKIKRQIGTYLKSYETFKQCDFHIGYSIPLANREVAFRCRIL